MLAHIDEDARLLTIPYRRHPVALFVRKDHRLARCKSVKIAELDGEPLIIREFGSTTRRAFEQALAAKKIEPRKVMEIGSREAIREAVIRGLGISYVSEAEFVADPSLRLIPIAGRRDLHLCPCRCSAEAGIKPHHPRSSMSYVKRKHEAAGARLSRHDGWKEARARRWWSRNVPGAAR